MVGQLRFLRKAGLISDAVDVGFSKCRNRRSTHLLYTVPSKNTEAEKTPSRHHPSLILAWEAGVVRASANIFKAIFGTSMGYMLRGSKNG